MTTLDELVALAGTARERAYAPYSDFKMGAATRTSSGEVHAGALVENVSLGLAMCAERVAVFSAVTAGATALDALALVAPRTDGALTLPCGACLQVAREFGDPDMEIVVADLDGAVERYRLGELAPSLPVKR